MYTLGFRGNEIFHGSFILAASSDGAGRSPEAINSSFRQHRVIRGKRASMEESGISGVRLD